MSERVTGGSNEDAERPTTALDPGLRSEFEASLRRPLRQRLDYSFIKTHKPVLDDAAWRSFDTMEEYRRWCRDELPPWLGYG